MNPLDSLLRRAVREWEPPPRAPVLPAGLSQCLVHEVARDGPETCFCCEAGIAAVRT